MTNNYKEYKDSFNNEDLKVIKSSSFFYFLISIIEGLFSGFIFGYIIYLSFFGKILIGDIVTYFETVINGKEVFSSLLNNFSQIYKDSLFIDQIKEFFNLKNEIDGNIEIKEIKSIEFKNVSYKYNNNSYVLKNINFTIKKSEKIAILGINGSGKTTFIRMITGLAFPTSGNLSLFGNSNKKDIQNSRRNIGALVEGPSLYPFMSAKENLKAQQIALGIDDDKNIEELLELVGLSDVGDKKSHNFSLGMKQRLGIAMSLVGDPDFLIWDEPINGLDPEGIKDLRVLIEKLNKENGKTLLISSHILGELENTATDFIIIDSGNIIEEISKDELLNKRKDYLYIETSDNKSALDILKNKYPDVSIKMDKDYISLANFYDVDFLSTLLSQNQINIREMRREKESLEEYVFTKIGARK